MKRLISFGLLASLILSLFCACGLLTKRKGQSKSERDPASVVNKEDPFVQNFVEEIENAPSGKY